jgi:hypothetical protein
MKLFYFIICSINLILIFLFEFIERSLIASIVFISFSLFATIFGLLGTFKDKKLYLVLFIVFFGMSSISHLILLSYNAIKSTYFLLLFTEILVLIICLTYACISKERKVSQTPPMSTNL